jgi:hypothetical protein
VVDICISQDLLDILGAKPDGRGGSETLTSPNGYIWLSLRKDLFFGVPKSVGEVILIVAIALNPLPHSG